MQALSTFTTLRAAAALALALTLAGPGNAFGKDVTITNFDAAPAPVKNVLTSDEAGDYPFQFTLQFSFVDGDLSGYAPAFKPDLAGRRLVIENISFFAYSSAVQNIAYGITATNQAAINVPALVMPAGTTENSLFRPAGPGGTVGYAVAATPIRLYVGADDSFIPWARRSDPKGFTHVYMTVTGHFEPDSH